MNSKRIEVLLPMLVVALTLAVMLTGCATSGKCSACSSTSACGQKNVEEAEISTATLERLIRSGTAATILDARSGKWDDGRRIPGAKALTASATAQQAATAIKSKDSLVVTYCNSLKCPASRALAKRLGELGYSNVLEYPHGVAGWAKAGNAFAETN